MPNIPQSPLQDGSAVTDADLVALLAGTQDVAPGLRPVADVLAALSAEPTLTELAGEAHALAEFRRRAVVPVPRRHARRRTAGVTSRLSAKAAAGAAAATLVLGGAATAAFANMLPAPIQRIAHDVLGAPDAPAVQQPGPARGKPAAPGQVASHGTSKSSAKSHSTSQRPGRHGHGQPGTGRGQQGNGQGQQGTGQGQQGNGQGQSGSGRPGQPGAGHPGQPGARHGRQGDGLGDSHGLGQNGGPASCGSGLTHAHWQRRQHATPGSGQTLHGMPGTGQPWIPKYQAPSPRPGCGVAAARWAGWPA